MAKRKPNENVDIAAVCAELQAIQRSRTVIIKSRIMQMNRLQAVEAGTRGYYSTMPDNLRKKLFKEASDVIGEIADRMKKDWDNWQMVDCSDLPTTISDIIKTTLVGIIEFDKMQARYERAMAALAKTLPVAAWVEAKDQTGFGVMNLAIVIGEAGDLRGYANPGKLWKRFGCAPWQYNGETLMGGTWKRRGKQGGSLPSEEWYKFGYSPRRRAIMHNVAEPLLKLNRKVQKNESGEIDKVLWTGPYRERYDQVKADAIANRPDWTVCPPCKGSGKKVRGSACANCKGTGKVLIRVHRHAMLLMAKMLLKNLWIQFTDGGKLCFADEKQEGKGKRDKAA